REQPDLAAPDGPAGDDQPAGLVDALGKTLQAVDPDPPAAEEVPLHEAVANGGEAFGTPARVEVVEPGEHGRQDELAVVLAPRLEAKRGRGPPRVGRQLRRGLVDVDPDADDDLVAALLG